MELWWYLRLHIHPDNSQCRMEPYQSSRSLNRPQNVLVGTKPWALRPAKWRQRKTRLHDFLLSLAKTRMLWGEPTSYNITGTLWLPSEICQLGSGRQEAPTLTRNVLRGKISYSLFFFTSGRLMPYGDLFFFLLHTHTFLFSIFFFICQTAPEGEEAPCISQSMPPTVPHLTEAIYVNVISCHNILTLSERWGPWIGGNN